MVAADRNSVAIWVAPTDRQSRSSISAMPEDDWVKSWAGLSIFRWQRVSGISRRAQMSIGRHSTLLGLQHRS